MIISQDPKDQLRFQQEIDKDAQRVLETLVPIAVEKYQKKMLIFEPKYKIIKEILKKTISLLS